MKTIISTLMLMFLFLSVCSAEAQSNQNNPKWIDMPQSECPNIDSRITFGERVIATSVEIMKGVTQRIGSCGEYAKAVYDCAGYREECRSGFIGRCKKTVFGNEGNWQKRDQCPVVEKEEDWNKIQLGDWIMYINLEFYSQEEWITHSVIFVSWIHKDRKNKEARMALVLEHPGGSKLSVGQLVPRTLTKIYCIKRAQEPGEK
jgi:hypothetical protein